MGDDDITVLFDRIRVLLQQPAAERAEGEDALEDTLTDGYARALALDADRLRTERAIHSLAGRDDRVAEVRILKARLALLEEEVAQLRGLLGTLARTR